MQTPSAADLASRLADADPVIRQEAARQLAGLVAQSREIIPELQDWLVKADGRARDAYINFCREYWKEAAPLVPALAPLLHDADHGNIIAQLLACMRTPGIPYLVEALRDVEARENPDLEYSDDLLAGSLVIMGDTLADEALNPNRHIIWALARLREAALPAYRVMLEDPDLYMRRAAIAALKSAGHSLETWEIAPDMVEAVCSVLGDDNSVLVHQALGVLQLMGAKARGAEETLVRLLRNTNVDKIRISTLYTLAGIGADSKATLEAAMELFAENNLDLIRAAATVIKRMGPAAAPAIPVLVRWAKDLAQTSHTLYEAPDAIGQIGQAALPAIRELSNATNVKLQECAARAIDKLEPALAELFIDKLVEAVRTTSDPKDCPEYITLLRLKDKVTLPPEALHAMEAYKQRRAAALNDEKTVDFNLERINRPESWERSSAAYNLSRATGRFDEVGRALLDAYVKTGDRDVAKYMIVMGAKIRAIAPDLVQLFFSDHERLAVNAIKILEHIAPDAPPETARVAWAVIGHESARVRAGAAVAMGACGPKVCEAFPNVVQRLCELLHATEPTVRMKAAWALGQLGARAASALPLLKACKRDLHTEIVCAAEDAIRRIEGAQSSGPAS